MARAGLGGTWSARPNDVIAIQSLTPVVPDSSRQRGSSGGDVEDVESPSIVASEREIVALSTVSPRLRRTVASAVAARSDRE